MLKHKDQWPEILKIADRFRLEEDKKILLLAMREVADGEEGNEFKIKAVKGTNLEEQAEWAIASLIKNERRWLAHIHETRDKISFIDFLAFKGGPLGTGYAPYNNWVTEINEKRKEIQYEFTRNIQRS